MFGSWVSLSPHPVPSSTRAVGDPSASRQNQQPAFAVVATTFTVRRRFRPRDVDPGQSALLDEAVVRPKAHLDDRGRCGQVLESVVVGRWPVGVHRVRPRPLKTVLGAATA